MATEDETDYKTTIGTTLFQDSGLRLSQRLQGIEALARSCYNNRTLDYVLFPFLAFFLFLQ